MPVQNARVTQMPARSDARGDVRADTQLEVRQAPIRPAAVDAVRWGAALLAQVGLVQAG